MWVILECCHSREGFPDLRLGKLPTGDELLDIRPTRFGEICLNSVKIFEVPSKSFSR